MKDPFDLRMKVRNRDSITMKAKPVEDVDKFQYLGAFVSNVGGGTISLDNRLADEHNSSSITHYTKLSESVQDLGKDHFDVWLRDERR